MILSQGDLVVTAQKGKRISFLIFRVEKILMYDIRKMQFYVCIYQMRNTDWKSVFTQPIVCWGWKHCDGKAGFLPSKNSLPRSLVTSQVKNLSCLRRHPVRIQTCNPPPTSLLTPVNLAFPISLPGWLQKRNRMISDTKQQRPILEGEKGPEKHMVSRYGRRKNVPSSEDRDRVRSKMTRLLGNWKSPELGLGAQVGVFCHLSPFFLTEPPYLLKRGWIPWSYPKVYLTWTFLPGAFIQFHCELQQADIPPRRVSDRSRTLPEKTWPKQQPFDI